MSLKNKSPAHFNLLNRPLNQMPLLNPAYAGVALIGHKPQRAWARTAMSLAALGLLGACSTQIDLSNKIDYRSSQASQQGLEVPPDLNQIARDNRYLGSAGVVSASTYQNPGAAAGASVQGNPNLAPRSLAAYQIKSQDGMRWLSAPLPAEQVWPALQTFWRDQGLSLVRQEPVLGVMETDWAENRGKLPKDFIRGLLGGLADPLYATGERDRFVTRMERVEANQTDIFIGHRGLEEVFSGERKESVTWQKRASDPQLEAEMLQRLLLALAGQPRPTAQDADGSPAAAAPIQTLAARARLVDGPALEFDDGFDRAWRRMALALDRSGFTVEDRDRGAGVFFVRYVNPEFAGKEEPGFFARLFGAKELGIGVDRYQIVLVKASNGKTLAKVQNSQSQAETGDAAKRILGLLLNDVK
jgi:outer membrane protein assembly factor BamC